MFSPLPNQTDYCPRSSRLGAARYLPTQEYGEIALAPAILDQATCGRLVDLIEETKKTTALAERSRIAHDMHDSLAQCLTAIYAQLEAASRLRGPNPEVADRCIGKAQDLSHRGLQEVRRLVAGLQHDAAQYCDVATSLRKLAEESSCNGGTKVSYVCHSAPRPVPPDIGYELIQIAREAVGNALRYARAKSVVLSLRLVEPNIELSIEDDGVGFSPEDPALAGGFGSHTMKKRAERIRGRLSIRSTLGTGASINISVSISKLNPQLCAAQQNCV
jgi:signal transduction histidine kinase